MKLLPRLRPLSGRELALIAASMIVVWALSGSNAFYTRIIELVFIYAMVGASLDLVTGYAGQFSLGHSGLFAVGAYAGAYGYLHLGIPFPFDGLFAMAITAIAGFIIGFAPLRLADLYLALATAAFAFIVQLAANDLSGITGGASGLGGLEPAISRYSYSAYLGNHYIWVCGVAFVIAFVVLRRIVQSRWGRAMVTIRGAEPLASSVGIGVRGVKLKSFVASATVTGLAGALFAHLGYISPDIFVFSLSVSFITIVFLGGSGTLVGAIIGAVVVVGVPTRLNLSANLNLTIYGLLLVAVMIVAPRGVAGSLDEAIRRLRRPLLQDKGKPELNAVGIEAGATTHGYRNGSAVDADGRLVASDIEMQFGGLKVLNGVGLSVRRGELLGLIGPNGSGKTTLLNILGGQLAPAAGTIVLDGESIEQESTAARASRGIARTFQHAALSESLTVRENVMVGAHLQGGLRFSVAAASVSKRLGEERLLAKLAEENLARLGIPMRYRDRLPAELPYGVLRLCEVAVALAAEPRYLLLDEPAAGLVEEEIAALTTVLRDCVAGGIGIVLVEHHLGMVLGLSDRIVVLEGGQMIMDGPPDQVARDPKVVEAYLGPGWAQEAAGAV